MHPNNKLYLLALLFAVPFSAAAPIFSGSNDIDSNGNFLPRDASGSVTASILRSGNLNRPDVFGDLSGKLDDMIGGLPEGILGPVIGKRDHDKRGFVGTPFRWIPAISDAPSPWVEEELIENEPPATTKSNHEPLEAPMGKPSSSESEAPAKEKRDPLILPGGVMGPWMPRFPLPPFSCSGHPEMCDGDPTTGPFLKRDVAGDLHGLNPPDIPHIPSKHPFGDLPPFANVCGRIGGCDFPPAPICAGAPGFCPGTDVLPDDVFSSDVKEKFKKRALVGELNGVIGTVNQAFDKIAGEIAPNLNPPDIPNIPAKRAVVGELNGVIGTVNQAFDKIAGEIAPNFNPPDIPNIPTKRAVVGDLKKRAPLIPGIPDFPLASYWASKPFPNVDGSNIFDNDHDWSQTAGERKKRQVEGADAGELKKRAPLLNRRFLPSIPPWQIAHASNPFLDADGSNILNDDYDWSQIPGEQKRRQVEGAVKPRAPVYTGILPGQGNWLPTHLQDKFGSGTLGPLLSAIA